MKAIIGLGNPGDKYTKTRHNLGFMAVDALLKKFEPLENTFWQKDKSGKSLTHTITVHENSLMLVKPQTHMNNSGAAVAALVSYFKYAPSDICVIYDDLDLPMGKMRVRFGGAAGGHHGVESIIEHLKTDAFLRIRLGIGHTDDEKKGKRSRYSEEYVLAQLQGKERSPVKSMITHTVRAVELISKHGIEIYMSKYNA